MTLNKKNDMISLYKINHNICLLLSYYQKLYKNGG